MRFKLRNGVMMTAALAVALVATGCFRTAGVSIEPTADTRAQNVATSTIAPLAATVELPIIPTSDGVPITVIPVGGDLVQPTNAPPATIDPSLIVTATPTEFSANAAVTDAPLASATPQFITPGVPLGLITPDTPAPLQTGEIAGGTVLPTSAAPNGLVTPTGLPGTDDECLYIVEPGDSLYAIALVYETTIDNLIAANPQLEGDPPVLFPGDMLRLSDCGDSTPTPIMTATRPIATLAPGMIITLTPNAAVGSPAPTTSSAQTVAPTSATGERTHVVRSGDSIYTIAIQYGVTMQAIINANSLSNPNSLQIGQELIIPPSSP
jgi:LysM repeat protein